MNATPSAYTLELSNYGSPFIRVAAKAGIDCDTLEISKDGSPWWGLEVAATAAWLLYVGSALITTMYVGSTEVTTAYVGSTVLKS
jgi:hypothetical protein